MTNFRITFSNPWLLLLLIPAAFFALFPYFRIQRKYRRTRNRIVSIICHMLVMVLSVAVLSGLRFSFDTPNTENEIILLVDSSDSDRDSREARDEFVHTVIDQCAPYGKVGVVTFGYNQVYAAPLSQDAKQIFSQYQSAVSPDTSATDIASALVYTRGLFSNPAMGRIVLLSDGLETDGTALSAVKALLSDGVRVDTAYFPKDTAQTDIQLVGVQLPDRNLAVGEEFDITLSVRTDFAGEGTVTLYDNGETVGSFPVSFDADTDSVTVPYKFSVPDLHELRFSLQAEGDSGSENNLYCAYAYLQVFDKVLLIESQANEADRLAAILRGEDGRKGYQVETVRVDDSERMPSTLDALREYDEVVLVNVANEDMPDGFDEILYDYVYKIGGGLFTVGGNKETAVDGETVPNLYNKNDLFGTLYQQMLPVQAIEYTPPVAVMIIIDCSGSMEAQDPETGKTKLDLAKEGAGSVLNSLTERDYCGVMSLSDKYTDEIPVTPVTQEYKIRAAIEQAADGGGTVYSGAFQHAGAALSGVRDVERRHVILVTDGQPGDSYEQYSAIMQKYYEQPSCPITFSIVSIGTSNSADLAAATEAAGGRYHEIASNEINKIPQAMREDIKVEEIKGIVYETFTPIIANRTAITGDISQDDMPTLDGYYGTKLKNGAQLILRGSYVPIYAQWKFGEGMVGSFMCDLNGTWSEDFLTSYNGQTILRNIVQTLFPTRNIRPSDISVEMREDNYTTNLSIYTALPLDQRVQVEIESPLTDVYGNNAIYTIDPGVEYTRVSFVAKTPGIHRVTVRKLDEAGETVSEYTTYKTFSYSEEYDLTADPEVGRALMQSICGACGGAQITEPIEVYRSLEKYVHRVVDPRIVFTIVALALFLLDIAVRKFKFRWPHEWIRDRKEKRMSARQNRTE